MTDETHPSPESQYAFWKNVIKLAKRIDKKELQNYQHRNQMRLACHKSGFPHFMVFKQSELEIDFLLDIRMMMEGKAYDPKWPECGHKHKGFNKGPLTKEKAIRLSDVCLEGRDQDRHLFFEFWDKFIKENDEWKDEPDFYCR